MKELLPWICSATSIIMIWLMGNKSICGPITGLISQAVWFAYVFAYWDSAWGLLPAVVVFTYVHYRNLRKWKRESR